MGQTISKTGGAETEPGPLNMIETGDVLTGLYAIEADTMGGDWKADLKKKMEAAKQKAQSVAKQATEAATKFATEQGKVALDAAKMTAEQAVDQVSQSIATATDELEKKTQEALATRGGYSKCGGVIGGFDDLQDYTNSLFSHSKEKMIRGIAHDVALALKIKPDFADKADIDKVVDILQSKVPSIKAGRKLVAPPAAQVTICKTLAKAINKRYGHKLVDPDETPEKICRNVSEIMHSLFVGLHSEFLTVAGDISRIVANLKTLDEYVDAAVAQLKESVNSCGDTALISQSDNIIILYGKIKEEIKRQMALLTNHIDDTVGPTSKSIITLLEDNDDFRGFVADLKRSVNVGTEHFQDYIANLLSGISTVAHAAELVNRALKKLGMSLKDYKNTKSLKDLRLKIFDMMAEKKPNSQELEKLFQAINILYKNDYNHDNIVKYLEKKMTYGGASIADSIDPEFSEEIVGRRHMAKKSLTKRIRNQKKLREMLFEDLNKVIQHHYQKIISAIHKITSKIGSDLALSDDFDTFVRRFYEFSNPDRENLHIALSGYRKDSLSKHLKNEYMSDLKTISKAIDPLLKGKSGELFREIKTSINELISAVDEFNDTFVKAITEIHVEPERRGITSDIMADRPRRKKGGDDMLTNSMQGGEDMLTNAMQGGQDEELEMTGGVESYIKDIIDRSDRSQFEHFVSMDVAKKELYYFYRIANIKKSLSIIGDEYKSYTEEYSNILGDEIGDMVNKINNEYNRLMKESDYTDQVAIANSFKDRIRAITIGAGIGANQIPAAWIPGGAFPGAIADLGAYIDANYTIPQQVKEQVDVYRTVLKLQKDIRIDLLKTCEALDLYLQGFTDGIAKNPDEIKNLSKILEQIDIVAKWFTDRSGDFLAYVFESFPQNSDVNEDQTLSCNAVLNADGNVVPQLTGAAANPWPDKGHYYEYAGGRLTGAGAGVGNPSLGNVNSFLILSNVKQLQGLIKNIERAVKSVRSLENIISTFSSLGSKYGDKSIYNNTFMNAGHIYKNLMNYIIIGSIGMGESREIADRTAIRAAPTPAGATEYGAAALAADYKAYMRIYLRKPSWQTSAIPGGAGAAPQLSKPSYNDIFTREDEFFIHILKAISSKIFTVVGTYSMLNKPRVTDESNSISPLRTILGGSVHDVEIPSVIDDATELYLRLPLMAEWYRQIFKFEKDGTARTDYKISMVPSADGIWSDLIKSIFVDAEFINDGTYHESILKQIILAINKIYKEYKNRKPNYTVRDIILAFIVEVNRRYGMLKQSEIEDFIDSRRANLTSSAYPDAGERTDYDILGADSTFGRSPAPSDKFQTLGTVSIKPKSIRQTLWNTVRDFRNNIDFNFDQFIRTPYNYKDIRFSFSEAIKQTKHQLAVAKTPNERYDLVAKLVRGITKYSNLEKESLVAFNELVSVPITILNHIYQVLYEDTMWIHSAAIRALCNGPVGAAGTNADVYLNTHYPDIGPAKTNTLAGFLGLAGGLGAVPNANIADTITRLINYIDHMAIDLNGLVDIKPTADGYPVLDFSNLRDLCVKMISHVRYVIDKFRTLLPKSVIAKYENNDCGGLSWLEEHLVEQLFNGRDKLGISDLNESISIIWKNVVSPNVANPRFNMLNLDLALMMRRLVFWDDGAMNAGARPRRAVSYTSQNANKMPFKLLPLFNSGNFEPVTPEEIRAFDQWKRWPNAMANPAAGAIWNNRIPPPQLPNENIDTMRYKKVLALTYLDTDLDINKWYATNSLLLAFNNLLSKYIFGLMDSTSHKIYLPLLETFASGVLGQQISDPDNQTIQDLFDYPSQQLIVAYAIIASGVPIPAVPGVVTLADFTVWFNNPATRVRVNAWMSANNGANITEDNWITAIDQALNALNTNIPYPENGKTLFQSIARSIYSIVNAVDVKTGVKRFQYTTLSDIPYSNREVLKANLPYLDKQFKLLMKRAILIKTILEDASVNITVPRGPAAVSGTRENMQLIVKNILGGIQNILKCSEMVQKELSDLPLYLETSEDSIRDFQNLYGKMPLMPISSMTFLLKDRLGRGALGIANQLDELLRTDFSSGSDKFKMLYGTRLILAQNTIEPKLEYMPGMKTIIDNYNKLANPSNSLGTQTNDLIMNTIHALRYLVDTYHHKIMNTQVGALRVEPLRTCNGAAIANPNFITPIQYDVKRNYGDIIQMTENSNIELNMRDIAQRVSGVVDITRNIDQRPNLRILNILDMNVVPINVHALQREVPLINIYNYSYTFDRMVQNYLIPDYQAGNAASMIRYSGAPSDTTRQLLTKQLIYPLETFSEEEYYSFVSRLMSGDTALDLGRPKYLSDQLWNKVLLNTIYFYQLADEAGPREELPAHRAQNAPVLGNIANVPVPLPPPPLPAGVVAPGAVPAAANAWPHLHRFATPAQYVDNVMIGYYDPISKVRRPLRDLVAPGATNQNQRASLVAYGREREGAIIIKQLEWITNIQRFIRLLMRDQLREIAKPIVSGHRVINKQITEYIQDTTVSPNIDIDYF